MEKGLFDIRTYIKNSIRASKAQMLFLLFY